MASSDYDRPTEQKRPVDSTSPPVIASTGWAMPLGVVLALLFVGALLFGLNSSRDNPPPATKPPVTTGNTGPVNPAPEPPSPTVK